MARSDLRPQSSNRISRPGWGTLYRRPRRRRRLRQPGGDPVPRLQALRLHRHPPGCSFAGRRPTARPMLDPPGTGAGPIHGTGGPRAGTGSSAGGRRPPRTSGRSSSSCRARRAPWRSLSLVLAAAGAVAFGLWLEGGPVYLLHAAHSRTISAAARSCTGSPRGPATCWGTTPRAAWWCWPTARKRCPSSRRRSRIALGTWRPRSSSRSRASTRSRTSCRRTRRRKIPLLEEVRRKTSRLAARAESPTRTGRR